MLKDDALLTLASHSQKIRAKGVVALALFGSVARGEESASSDIDLLIDIDRTRTFTLIDLAELRLFLTELLQRPVDIALRDNLKPMLRAAILAEAVEIFH
jgi:predicted nucleotidyltransferase